MSAQDLREISAKLAELAPLMDWRADRSALAALAERLERLAVRDHNQAARLDNLAGALQELQADLEAGHKPPKHLADLAGYWARIAAEIAKEAGQ